MLQDEYGLIHICNNEHKMEDSSKMWVMVIIQLFFLLWKVFNINLFNQFGDMTEWAPEFTRNFHMTVEQFEDLYQRLHHRLLPKKDIRPDAIGPKQRLAYTLE